jgi:hypothetical protein
MIARANGVVDDLPQGPYPGSSVFEWTVNGMCISLRLADLDRLGCLLENAGLKPASGVRLNVDPASLAQKFSYLGERLVIVEQEKEEGRAILRSNPPSMDAAGIYFFEMVVDRDEGLSLARYVYDRLGEGRKMIAAPLTTHALGRLIGELRTLASGN